MNRITTTILITVLAATAQLAQAGDQIDDSRRQVKVLVADLNLSTAEGAATLYQRIKHAAWKVCKRPDGGFGDAGVFLHCYHNALAHAVGDLGNAGVTAQYNEEHKQKLLPATLAAKLTK